MTTNQSSTDQEGSRSKFFSKAIEVLKVAGSNVFTGLCLGLGGVLATKAMGFRGLRLSKGKSIGNVLPLEKRTGTGI